MKILVTGGSGFIGRAVIANLHSRGIRAVTFDRSVDENVDSIRGDILDSAQVNAAVLDADRVIHLAGVLGTSEWVRDPWAMVEPNIKGTLNVLNALRIFRVPGVYITVGNHWMHNPYAITKTATERLVWMYNKEHGTEVAVVRALSAYGPGQKDKPIRKIMPNFILPALRGEPLTIYGDGEQVADMVHVDDVADVLVRAAVVPHGQYIVDPREDGYTAQKFDACTGRRTTVNQIAEMVLREVGGGEVRHVPMRPGEPEHAVVLGDPMSLRPLYRNRLPDFIRLEDGIRDTVKWYRDRT